MVGEASPGCFALVTLSDLWFILSIYPSYPIWFCIAFPLFSCPYCSSSFYPLSALTTFVLVPILLKIRVKSLDINLEEDREHTLLSMFHQYKTFTYHSATYTILPFI